jgi:hypothetical protein
MNIVDAKVIEQLHRRQSAELNRRGLYRQQAERLRAESIRQCTIESLVDGIRWKQPKHRRALHAYVDYCSEVHQVTPEEFVLQLELCEDEIWLWALVDTEQEIMRGEWD